MWNRLTNEPILGDFGTERNVCLVQTSTEYIITVGTLKKEAPWYEYTPEEVMIYNS